MEFELHIVEPLNFKKMKENRIYFFLFIVGILCLPLTLYKYYTLGNQDIKYLLGGILSLWLLYDYYIYRTNKTHILQILKENFRNKDSE